VSSIVIALPWLNNNSLFRAHWTQCWQCIHYYIAQCLSLLSAILLQTLTLEWQWRQKQRAIHTTLEHIPYNPFSNCWKKSEPPHVTLATGHRSDWPPADTYRNFPLSSRKPFFISSPYLPPHFTTSCNVRTWGLMTCKIRVVTEVVLQPAESSFTLKGSLHLQQHPLACYSRIGNEKLACSVFKTPVFFQKISSGISRKYPTNDTVFCTKCTA
jgi:hypothetical protein